MRKRILLEVVFGGLFLLVLTPRIPAATDWLIQNPEAEAVAASTYKRYLERLPAVHQQLRFMSATGKLGHAKPHERIIP